MSIAFIDLQAQRARIADDIDARLSTVLEHGQFVLGPEVREFEDTLKSFVGTQFALGCSNGTDAIVLSLLALEIGPGDAVFCPSFTYCATAEAVAHIGATPVFIDIDRRTYNMDSESLAVAIIQTQSGGKLKPRAILAVDLFGQCADYPALKSLAETHGLSLISDAAQGLGATLNGYHSAHWADLVTTSFFPAKPLGCYGDGGAVLTNDPELARRLDSLHVHGKGVDKYDNIMIGMNSRLDTMQAAVLLSKMQLFEDEIEQRNIIAARYNESLASTRITTPFVVENGLSTWAQYTIEVDDPDALMAALRAEGIPSARYYPRPIHAQTAYAHFPVGAGGLSQTEAAMTRVISLPMHPYLDAPTQDRIIDAVKAAV